jgi:hypothetical protein
MAAIMNRAAIEVSEIVAPDDQRIDVYRLWDILTSNARHGGNELTHLPAILEFAPDRNLGDLARVLTPEADRDTRANLAPELCSALTMSIALAPESKIHTAIIEEDWVELLDALLNQGVLLRYTLGAPCNFMKPTSKASKLAAVTHDREHVHTLGVIDDGCCVAHQDFRAAPVGYEMQSRLLAVWDQEPSPEPNKWWKRYQLPGKDEGVAYGTELTHGSIGDLLDQFPALGETAERDRYKDIGRSLWTRPWRTHGSRVMHLIAGRPQPLVQTLAGDPATQVQMADVSEMPLIFVQLPVQTVEDTSGDSLGIHVLDGARYIVERTRQLAGKLPWSTTICISLGSLAGPHDGTTMAEQALRELGEHAVDNNGKVTIVVAAGNSGYRQRGHAVGRVGGDAGPARFTVRVPPGTKRDSFVEVWLPDQISRLRSLTITAIAPDGRKLMLKRGQQGYFTRAGGRDAALFFPHKAAQGNNGTLALLCVAATARDRLPRVLSEPGFWSIEVKARTTKATEFHAWIERDDIIVKNAHRQQVRFEPRSGQDETLTDRSTLASLANHAVSDTSIQGVRVASAFIGSAAFPYVIAPYASDGPLLGPGPSQPALDFAASQRSASLPGVRLAGFFSGSRCTLGGTSAAAPQVARRLAGQCRDRFKPTVQVKPGVKADTSNKTSPSPPAPRPDLPPLRRACQDTRPEMSPALSTSFSTGDRQNR